MIFESGMKTNFMENHYIQFRSLIMLALVSLCLCSCEKDVGIVNDVTTTFDTDYYEMEFIVEEQDRVGFQIFTEETFTNNITDLLLKAGFDEDKIEEVALTEAEISIIDTVNYSDFDMLKFIELTVYTDALGDSTIAWLNPVPAGTSTIYLDSSGENIYPYFMEPGFIMAAQGFLKKRVKGEMKLQARVKFRIKTSL